MHTPPCSCAPLRKHQASLLVRCAGSCFNQHWVMALIFGGAQLLLSQVPNLEEAKWSSLIAAIASVGYSTIALGLSIWQSEYTQCSLGGGTCCVGWGASGGCLVGLVGGVCRGSGCCSAPAWPEGRTPTPTGPPPCPRAY